MLCVCVLLVSEFTGQIFTPGSFSSLKLGNRKNINKASVLAKNQSVNVVFGRHRLLSESGSCFLTNRFL